jgi:hypothetical protein
MGYLFFSDFLIKACTFCAQKRIEDTIEQIAVALNIFWNRWIRYVDSALAICVHKGGGEEAHSPAGEGLGESQCRRLEKA